MTFMVILQLQKFLQAMRFSPQSNIKSGLSLNSEIFLGEIRKHKK